VKGYKRCKCRDGDNRELGTACGALKRKDGSWNPSHGTWYAKAELPLSPGGQRVVLRTGGFATQDEMTEWFEEAMHLLSIPEKGPDGHEVRLQIRSLIQESRRRKEDLPGYDDLRRRYAAGVAFRNGQTGDYLIGWLERHEEYGDWSETTMHSYRRTVERLFLPSFGRVPLGKLAAKHILDMFRNIDAANARLLAAKASSDPEVRRSVAGLRPTGPATKVRILAVLNSALGEAAVAGPGRPQLIPVSPGAGLRLSVSGKQSGVKVKPKLWTAERERAWREDFALRSGGMSRLDAFQAWRSTPARPGKVMVWRPDQVGAFLDAAERERLYALFCVIAYCALRRGEAVGQKLAEIDYETGALMVGPTIVQVGGKALAKDDAKTEGSQTWVRAGPEVMEPLRALRQQQITEKLRWGPAWSNTGYVHTLQDGNPYDPGYVSTRFERVAWMAGLPPVSLRDVRHCAPTFALAAGKDIKAVSEMMRHTSVKITADVYSLVLPELAAEVSGAVASMIPRRKKGAPSPTDGLPTVSRPRTETNTHLRANR
jgi:integrase